MQIVDIEPVQLNPKGITNIGTGMYLTFGSTVPDKKQGLKQNHF